MFLGSGMVYACAQGVGSKLRNSNHLSTSIPVLASVGSAHQSLEAARQRRNGSCLFGLR